MLKNPYLNALLAAAYIIVIVLALSSFEDSSIEETILMPITMLSLLVFSAALMGALFFYQPLSLFLENRKSEALAFFFKTLGTFAGFVVLSVGSLILTSVL